MLVKWTPLIFVCEVTQDSQFPDKLRIRTRTYPQVFHQRKEKKEKTLVEDRRRDRNDSGFHPDLNIYVIFPFF